MTVPLTHGRICFTFIVSCKYRRTAGKLLSSLSTKTSPCLLLVSACTMRCNVLRV